MSGRPTQAERLDHIDSLLPPCPTCGGTCVINKDYWSQDADDCPDCVDGKVSIERMAQVFAAVFDPAIERDRQELTVSIDYLRGIR